MGRELEEELIRTHQPGQPQFVALLVKSRITLGGAQGLVNQILKQELQPSGGRYRILYQETESFSRV